MPKQTVRVKGQDVEVPRISRIRVVWMSFNGWKSGPVCRAVNVGSVFNFNRLFEISDKSPKLSFDILLGDGSVTVKFVVERHLLLEIALFEIVRLLLKLLEGVQTSFFKSELAVADKASRAVPFDSVWLALQWRIKAARVVSMIA